MAPLAGGGSGAITDSTRQATYRRGRHDTRQTATTTPFRHSNLCSTLLAMEPVEREIVEHPPDRWAGELDGMHIRYGADPIPVTVKVTWDDGTEGEVNGWTSQWTKTHVCVVRESAPPFHPFWVRASDVRRREADG